LHKLKNVPDAIVAVIFEAQLIVNLESLLKDSFQQI